MECDRAQEILWPPEHPKLAGERVVEARAHVASCAACRSFFDTDRALEPARETVLVQAPVTLRDGVFDALAARRTLRRTRAGAATRWLQIGGVLLVGAVGGTALWFGRSGPPPTGDDGSAFVDDYVRRAVSADRIDTADPAEVTRFLTRELGTALQPLRADGLTLLGAEICLIDGRRGALVRYRRGEQTITHYVVPGPGSAPRPPEQARAHAAAAGLAVVTWSNGAVVHALVADVPADTLIALLRPSHPD